MCHMVVEQVSFYRVTYNWTLLTDETGLKQFWPQIAQTVFQIFLLYLGCNPLKNFVLACLRVQCLSVNIYILHDNKIPDHPLPACNNSSFLSSARFALTTKEGL